MYIAKKLTGIGFEEAIEKVTNELSKEKFGVLTEIDVKATLKKKLDADFRNYKILGFCNPPFAHKALSLNDKVGVLLPCNVIVQELDDAVEVFAMDPGALMAGEGNPDLRDLARDVTGILKRVIEDL
jgi:uncharacterized protein (DUF302 family)